MNINDRKKLFLERGCIKQNESEITMAHPGRDIPVYTFTQPKENTFGAQLKELIGFLKFLRENPTIKEITISLENLEFIQPLLILSLSAVIQYLIERGITVNVLYPTNKDCRDYIKNIGFSQGFKPDKTKSWSAFFDRFKQKSYLPIVNFPIESPGKKTMILDKVISKINTLVKEKLTLDSQYETAIYYLVSEMADNIVEHSGAKRGWIFLQYYPNNEYLDICLIDMGKTILGSYKEHEYPGIITDTEALKAALEGISTKSIERGTGIRSSKAISSIGLKGDFTLISGKGLFYDQKIFPLPVNWPGTIVAIRIKRGVLDFDLYNFV